MGPTCEAHLSPSPLLDAAALDLGPSSAVDAALELGLGTAADVGARAGPSAAANGDARAWLPAYHDLAGRTADGVASLSRWRLPTGADDGPCLELLLLAGRGRQRGGPRAAGWGGA